MNWVTYLNTKDPDIQEIQMAVLSLQVSSGLGAKNPKLEDFLISGKKKQSQTTKKPLTAFDSFAAIATDFKGL